MSESSVGTMEVREKHRFDEKRLHDFLHENIPGYAGPLTVEQFKGGQSNPTYKLVTPRRSYVLRRKPPGLLLQSAHAVDREYRVITALAGTEVPVPATYCLCENESVIGTAFYVMDFVEGRVLWNPQLPGMSPEQRRALYMDENRVIAALHSVDYKAVGLEAFGKPGNYFERQITRWTKQYQASETETIEAMNKLIDWLPRNIPPGDETCIVHGDFRIDNAVTHATEPRLTAVLDWELSTLGHPLADFSYHCMTWRLPGGGPGGQGGLLGVDLKTLGIPSEEEYVRMYCERTGRDAIDPDHWKFYIAYNLFRVAGITQGIMGRIVAGTAASQQAMMMARMARPLAETSWSIAQEI